MKLPIILSFLKAIIPTKKVSAYLLGLIAAALAVFMGVNNSDLKEEYCKSAPVELPAQVEQAPVVETK